MVTELSHAVVSHHLSRLRAADTPAWQFRQHARSLGTILAAHATAALPTEDCSVTTPIETTTCQQLKGRIAAVPILRAGLGMIEPLTEMIPEIEVWHLGLYRDEQTAMPVHYYDKLPSDNPTDVALVLDPMLATGGSAAMAIETLKKWGVPKILMLSIIAAPEGIEKLTSQFPDVDIFTCAIDRMLNDHKYIVPGLGDAGDRMFGTQ